MNDDDEFQSTKMKVLQFDELKTSKNYEQDPILFKRTNLIKLEPEKTKNFFVFGKNSKQINFRKSPIRKPVKIGNERYNTIRDTNSSFNVDQELANIKNDLAYDNVGFKINYSPKQINTIFSGEEVNIKKPNKLDYRPKTAMTYKKPTMKKLKKIEDSHNKTNIAFVENNKYKVFEQNLLFDETDQKPLINDVLKIKFSKEERTPYSPDPRENRRTKRAITNAKVDAKPRKSEFRNPKTVKEKDRSNLFKEENFAGDNLNADEFEGYNSAGIKEDEFEEMGNPIKTEEENINTNDDNNNNSNDIVNTINMIAKNPEKFKYTNNLLKVIGEFTKNNANVVFNKNSEKEKFENAMKEFEKSAVDRKRVYDYKDQIDKVMQSQEDEIANLKSNLNNLI